MSEEAKAPEGAIIGGSQEEVPALALTPQQQAEDILNRQNEFNAKLDKLCKEYKFAITVVRKDLPNGFVFEPQLMDTKFMPKAPINAGPAPKPEAAPEVAPEVAPAEAPKA